MKIITTGKIGEIKIKTKGKGMTLVGIKLTGEQFEDADEIMRTEEEVSITIETQKTLFDEHRKSDEQFDDGDSKKARGKKKNGKEAAAGDNE